MKKLVIISLVLGVFLTSCHRDIFPDARFTVNYVEVQPGDIVHFTDLSEDAVEYHWDFDDGEVSTLRSPDHVFDDEGDYMVTLTVTSIDGRTDVTSLVIHVWYTILEVTAAEWNPAEVIDYIIPGAFVVLYETYDDWYDDVDAIVWGNADSDGIITFLGLDTWSYWVYVEADITTGHYDNWDFRDYDPDYYLSTPVLTPFEYNYWVAWADFFPNKSLEKRRPNYVGEKIKADRLPLKEKEDVSE